MGEIDFVITINNESIIIDSGHHNSEINALRIALDIWEKNKIDMQNYYIEQDIRDIDNNPINVDMSIYSIKITELIK